MRRVFLVLLALTAFVPSGAGAQCFNRFACADPTAMEIHSQINLNVPVAAQASPADTMKTMEDARRDLYSLSNRECDTLKSIYGGDCSLTQVNINSSIQDRVGNGKTAYVSISNTYMLKRSK